MSDMTTQEMPTGGASAGPRRLVRTPDKKIAGVASGIAHYLGVDPTVVRIAFLLLIFAGGIGILLYLACWLVMPKGELPPAGADARGVEPATLGAIAALVLGIGLLFGWSGLGHGFLVAAGIALVAGGVWLLVRDRPDDGSGGGAPALPQPTPPGTPSTGVAVELATPPAARPVDAPPAGRGVVTASVLSLLSIGVALLVAGALADWFELSTGIVLAAALVVVGAGLVLASVVERTPWLFVVGGLLTAALLVTAAVEPLVEDGVGDRTIAPASAAALEPRYAYGIGELTLDLRGVSPVAARRVEVELGMGALTVIVPEDGAVVVDAHVDAGEISLPDRRSEDGWDESARYVQAGSGGPALVIDAELGFGELEVRRG